MDLQSDHDQLKEIENSDFIDQNNETSDHTANISESTESCTSDGFSELKMDVSIDNNASNGLICLNNSDVQIYNSCMPENGVNRADSVHTNQKIADEIQDVDLMPMIANQDLIIETNILGVSQKIINDMNQDEITRENSISSNRRSTMQSTNSEDQLPFNTNIRMHEKSESPDPVFSIFKDEELENEVELFISQNLSIESDTMYKENDNIKAKSTDMEPDTTATNVEPLSEVHERDDENKDSKKNELYSSEHLEGLLDATKNYSDSHLYESSHFIENQSIYMELENTVEEVSNVDNLPGSSVPSLAYSSVESCEYMTLGNVVTPSSFTERLSVTDSIHHYDSSNSSDSPTSSDSDSSDDNEKRLSSKIRQSLSSLINFSSNDDENPSQDIKIYNSKSLDVLNDESYYECDSQVIKPVPAPRERKLKIQPSDPPDNSTGCSPVPSSHRKPVPTPRKKKLESGTSFPIDGNQDKKTNSESSDSNQNIERKPDKSETHTSTHKKSLIKRFGWEKSHKPKEIFNTVKVFFKKNKENKNFPTKFYTNDI